MYTSQLSSGSVFDGGREGEGCGGGGGGGLVMEIAQKRSLKDSLL